jgi:hypothetical protein
MASFTFNQANGTLLSAISATWAGDVSTLEVQSSVLQAVSPTIFSTKTAYLNEAGSSYAVAKYPAQPNGNYTFIRSTSGLYSSGYAFFINPSFTNGNLIRNNSYAATYSFSGGHNPSATATEIRVEQVGADVKVYAGPIGSAVLIGTYTDGSPLSGGYSGFYLVGGGAATPTITAFDNGVAAYEARITWAEAQYQSSGVSPSTDYSEPLSRGIFRGIERGVA